MKSGDSQNFSLIGIVWETRTRKGFQFFGHSHLRSRVPKITKITKFIWFNLSCQIVSNYFVWGRDSLLGVWNWKKWLFTCHSTESSQKYWSKSIKLANVLVLYYSLHILISLTYYSFNVWHIKLAIQPKGAFKNRAIKSGNPGDPPSPPRYAINLIPPPPLLRAMQ